MIKKYITLFIVIIFSLPIYSHPQEEKIQISPEASLIVGIQSIGDLPEIKSLTLSNHPAKMNNPDCSSNSSATIPGLNRSPLFLLYNKNGDIIYRTPFNYLEAQTVPPALPGNDDQSPDVLVFSHPEVYLIVPYFTEASSIEIYNPGEQTPTLIKDFQSEELEIQNNSPKDLAITTPAPAPTQEGKLYFLVVASGYDASNIATFVEKASELKSYLLSHEPFLRYGSDVEVNLYTNLTDLQCHNNCNNIQRLICCNTSKVMDAATASGYLFDEIIVLHNTDEYCGGGYREYLDTYKTNSYSSYAMSYHGSQYKEVILHELGHSFGNLCDEYSYTTEGYSYSLCVNCRENCSIWNSISNNCITGCSAKSDYFRPDTSIMYSLSYENFNSVSIHASYSPDGLNKRILFFMGDSIPFNIIINSERKEERAWIIKKQYGELKITLENLEEYVNQGNTPIVKVRVYRTNTDLKYEAKEDIAISEFQDNQYTYIDQYLDKNVSYTYRVDAFDQNGNVIQVSNEVTI